MAHHMMFLILYMAKEVRGTELSTLSPHDLYSQQHCLPGTEWVQAGSGARVRHMCVPRAFP